MLYRRKAIPYLYQNTRIMASTADIKNGMCIHFNHAPCQIIEFLHVKPGKGAAFVRTKLRNLNDGRVLEHTFPSGTKLEVINIEFRTYQYLYNDPDGYHYSPFWMKPDAAPDA